MYTDDIGKFIERDNIPLVRALESIDANGWGILFIVDNDNRLVGSLTDGDIRKWILKSGDIRASITDIVQRNPRFVYIEQNLSESDIIKKMIHEKIIAIPLIDDERHIIDIVFRFSEYEKKSHEAFVLNNTPIIIMAGGKGTRLNPYTKILPKPLIPIGNIPIIERIMNRFSEYGADRFFVTVNYKKEMIKSYFSDIRPRYSIVYIDEDVPMGTAGSIRLINETFSSPVLISNCDTLIEEDYGKILKQHRESKNDMTIVTSIKNTDIPYGVIHTKNDGLIVDMEEKPRLTYQINTGMYIVDPEYLKLIPTNSFFHMTDLAEKMIKLGHRVGVYPISETAFLDMGELEEMRKMEERIVSSIE